MHEPRRVQTSVDGNKPKCLFQGRSLFGMETYGETRQRLHGYAAGRITLGQAEGTVVLWPRSGERLGAEIHLDRDAHQGLPKGREDTEPYRFALARPCVPQAATANAKQAEARQRDEVFNRALAETLDQALLAHVAAPLRDALIARLAGRGSSVGDKLCALEEEDAVAKLVGALAVCLKQVPGGDASRALRIIARRVLGWLLVRFVREEWFSQGHGVPSGEDVSVGVEVGSEAGAEVLWGRWGQDDEPPSFRIIGRRVIGVRNLLAGTAFPEEGCEQWSGYLDDAKAALWIAMFGEKPPAAFGPKEDERLRSAFAFDRRAHSGSRFYLTVRNDDIAEPLAQPEVLRALQQNLGLRVLFVADGPEDRFFSIGETRLQDMIKQCLNLLEEHGDD